MIKKVLSIILVTVFFAIPLCGSAESKDTVHDKDIAELLLGPGGASSDEEALALLQWATYFSMDCIGRSNDNDQLWLDKLKQYGVGSAPSKVSDFHYDNGKYENQHHERKTHLGWSDVLYGNDDIAHWVATRKPMMIETFTRIFITGKKGVLETLSFGLISPGIDVNVQRQCESLAAIVYYTHILGDHCYNTRMTLPDRIPLVRHIHNESNPDLLGEIETYLPLLFPNQKASHHYNSVISGIKSIRSQWMVNVGAYDIVNDEQYKAYQTEAKKLMKLLKENIYHLLEEEDFFKKVFCDS